MDKQKDTKVIPGRWYNVNDRNVSMKCISAKRILLRLEDGRRIMYDDLKNLDMPILVTHWMEISKISRS